MVTVRVAGLAIFSRPAAERVVGKIHGRPDSKTCKYKAPTCCFTPRDRSLSSLDHTLLCTTCYTRGVKGDVASSTTSFLGPGRVSGGRVVDRSSGHGEGGGGGGAQDARALLGARKGLSSGFDHQHVRSGNAAFPSESG
jgi:hypothetical protein